MFSKNNGYRFTELLKNEHNETPLNFRIKNRNMMYSFTYEYHFNKVSYQQGLKNIHSFENIEIMHRIGVPFFNVLNSSQPTSVGRFTVMAISYYILGRETQNLYVFTDKINESSIICSIHQQPQMLMVFRVLPSSTLSNGQGHILKINVHYTAQSRWIRSILYGFFKTICALQDKPQFNQSTQAQTTNRNSLNFEKYKSMVFQKT